MPRCRGREGVGEDGAGVGQEHGAADPLEHAHHDHVEGTGRAAHPGQRQQDREDGEDQEAQVVHAHPAVDVADAPEGDHQHRGHHHVAHQHPQEERGVAGSQRVEVDAPEDVRKGDEHDRRVDRGHRDAQGGVGERDPLVVGPCRAPGGVPAPPVRLSRMLTTLTGHPAVRGVTRPGLGSVSGSATVGRRPATRASADWTPRRQAVEQPASRSRSDGASSSTAARTSPPLRAAAASRRLRAASERARSVTRRSPGRGRRSIRPRRTRRSIRAVAVEAVMPRCSARWPQLVGWSRSRWRTRSWLRVSPRSPKRRRSSASMLARSWTSAARALWVLSSASARGAGEEATLTER